MKKLLLFLLLLPFAIKAQVVVYDIPVGQLVGLSNGCATGHYFSAANVPYGITWTSTGANTPSSVTVQLYRGIDCDPSALPIELNGVSQGTVTPHNDCNCTPTTAFVESVTMDPLDYNFGATNTVLITAASNNGLSPNSAWSGAFARVTVDYSCTPGPPLADDANIDTTSQCSITLTAPTATSDCYGLITGTTTDPTTYSAIGTYTVNWTYDDLNGGTSTQVQTVTIIADTTDPVAMLSTLPDVTTECSVTVTTIPKALDNCSSAKVIYDIPASQLINLVNGCGTGHLYTTSPQYGFSWASTGTMAPSSVIVELYRGIDCDPNPLPISLNGVNQGNVSAHTDCNCTPTTAFVESVTMNPANYNVGGSNQVLISTTSNNGLSPNSSWGSTYARVTVIYGTPITGTTTDPLTYNSEGSYVITWTYDDGSGNTTTQTQNVIVDDITAPVADVANLDTTLSQCSTTFTATAPTATDNCAGAITGTTTDALTYTSPGSYTITWTYDDGNGNTTTQTQTIDISGDTTDPVVDVANLDTIVQCSNTYTATAPTATDNCAGTITGTTTDPTTVSGAGTYSITWTYDDGSGNIITQVQNIDITGDITAPVADVANLDTTISQCSTTFTAVTATATDNCSGAITGTTTDPLTYSTVGTHTITWTYDDGNGNTSTQTQTITITGDITAPVADVANLDTTISQCSTTFTAVTATATDNCSGAITGTTTDPLTYSTVGTHTITWTYDDGNGNTSTQTQTITITGDITAPVADVANLDTTLSQCSTAFTAVTATATDNCSGTITGTTTDPLTYTTVGTHTITWTYDDGNGNTSTQTQTITITGDITAPVADVSNIDMSGMCSVTATAPTATDNCAGAITGTTGDPLTYNSPGSYTVTWTYNDGNGNTSTQTQNITVTAVDTAVSLSGNTLTANASGATYAWLDCSTNTVVSGETAQSFTPAVNGDYAVIVTQSGCSDTSSCYTVLPIGINEINASAKVALFPNPTADGIVNVTLSNPQGKLVVTNVMGQVVLEQAIQANKFDIDLSGFENGMFFVNFEFSATNKQLFRVVKNK